MEGVERVYFDTETDGLDWKRNHVVGYAVGIERGVYIEGYYFPIRHAGGGNVEDPARVIEWIKDWAKEPTLSVVGHNLKFDLHFAANDGIEFAGPLEDTMVNQALINENMGSYSLDEVSKYYRLNLPKKGDELYAEMARRFGGAPTRYKQMENFHKMPGDHPLVVDYVLADVNATAGAHRAQQRHLDTEDLRRVQAVENRVIRTLFRMERRGVYVSVEAARTARAALEFEATKARALLPDGLNVKSPKQLQKWLSEKGVSGWPRTDKGNDSFPEVWLKTTEPGRIIVRARKTERIISAFLDPLMNEHLFHGRVHPTFNQLRQDDYGTVSGRLSASDPNLQQVPKRDRDLAKLFRSVFFPPPGHLWAANDYTQQEFRVFAHYSKSPLLIAGYSATPPLDIHTQVATLLDVPRDPTAKTMNLGMLYGMGAKKLAAQLGTDEATAAGLRSQWDRLLPEGREFLNLADSVAKRRGYVKTYLGRRRRFPDPRETYKAGNSVIQGSSADITKAKMVEIDDLFVRENARSQLFLQVHDELDWSIAPGEEELHAKALAIMQDFGPDSTMPFLVPITAESKLGANWREATFGKE